MEQNDSSFSGKLLLFCGPSGSGKTTIVHHLLKKYPQLSFSVSATTRNKRYNETDGIDYYFISLDDFKNKIAAGEFVEWQEVYENGFYGTLRSEVERITELGKCVVFDVDVEGGLNVKKMYKDRLVAVFVRPPSIEDLKKRLKARATETPQDLERRILKAADELKYEVLFDHVILNQDLEKSLLLAENIAEDCMHPVK